MSTAAWVVMGAVIGAGTSLLFVARTRALSAEAIGTSEGVASRRRLLAIRNILVIYSIVALICFGVVIAIGDVWLIGICGLIAAIACIGLVVVWRKTRGQVKELVRA